MATKGNATFGIRWGEGKVSAKASWHVLQRALGGRRPSKEVGNTQKQKAVKVSLGR